MNTKIKLLAIAVGCLAFQSVQADLLFSDGFNYTPGDLGGNVNPGNSTAWSSGNNNLAVVSGNLTYAGLEDMGGNELAITNGVSAGTIYNSFDNQTSGQIYYSFLFNSAALDSKNNYITALNPGTSTPNGGSDAIDAYYYSDGHIDLRANPNGATAGTGSALSLDTTYLIVEMIDLDNATASLWIDPDSSSFGGTAPTATASLTGISATAVDDVGFKAQSSAGGPYLIDDVRIGTTWADVTPVPEPSTLALGGLGLLGLISRFRRGRR